MTNVYFCNLITYQRLKNILCLFCNCRCAALLVQSVNWPEQDTIPPIFCILCHHPVYCQQEEERLQKTLLSRSCLHHERVKQAILLQVLRIRETNFYLIYMFAFWYYKLMPNKSSAVQLLRNIGITIEIVNGICTCVLAHGRHCCRFILHRGGS